MLSALGFDTGRITKEGLKRLNLVVATLLFIEAIVLLLIGNANQGSRPVTLGYTTKDSLSTATSGQASYLPATHHFFDISLLYILVFTLLLASVAHLTAATLWRSTYETDLNKAFNRLRGRFAAVIGGLVMVILALLVGVSDIAFLILIFAATAGSNLLGMLTEQLRLWFRAGEKMKFWGGIMPAIAAWLAVAIYVKSSYIYGNAAPSYIYFIPGVMLILYILTAVIRHKQFNRSDAGGDMSAERTYIVLNFVALTALGWTLYGWLLH
jgi:hypothetical protein